MYKIGLVIEYSAENKSVRGYAAITDRDEIREAIKVLNRIKAYQGFYSISDLPAESPSAIITIYNSEDDTIGDEVAIYYDILMPSADKYCKVRLSEHDKIADLCKKYGECYIGD